MYEVVGLFPSRAEAEQAMDELLERGYDAESVGYLDRHRDEAGGLYTEDDDYEEYDTDIDSEAGKGAAGGAIGGAAVGAGAGILASAGLLLVPGIGPFLAAGTLAGTLGATAAGAVGGAALGGAAGAIFGDDADHYDHETSAFYREGAREGLALVSVMANDDEYSEVGEVLRRSGAKRVDTHGDEGWLE